ncbi:cytochrome c oxidase subunit 6a, mitochondrial [Amaranthus tricolor]|uniref:cytochrome c oxidase subunit 6a, mitochondrial n=1 Tax=Amaranthus tricolor TaxID=29722 RepID=UPI00258E3119|nr:cytochrome c oxidase subunit 6a, mitochondrial [Amaranthus tricolor]
MAMTSGKLRSSVQSALRNGRSSEIIKRTFSSSSHQDVEYEAKEASKWEKITYLGIVSCTVLAVINLSKGHHHFEEPPAYPYLHIRNKEFPWGPDGLFEVKEHH